MPPALPDRRCAGAASCCWTMGPKKILLVQSRRIELRPSRLQRDVRPVHQDCRVAGCRGRSRTCSADVQSVFSVPVQSARQSRPPPQTPPPPPPCPHHPPPPPPSTPA